MVTSFIWSQCIANQHSEWKAIILVQDTLAFRLAMESPNLSSLCLATFEFLGGWPLLRVLATCRAARGCEPWANKAFETLQVLGSHENLLGQERSALSGHGLAGESRVQSVASRRPSLGTTATRRNILFVHILVHVLQASLCCLQQVHEGLG